MLYRGMCGFLLILGFASAPVLAQNTGTPETVMVTFHAKSGSEAELQRVIARHWEAAARLKMLEAAPHVTLRGSEDSGKTYFVEIFTWRDGSVPDAAPEEIRKIWEEMNRLVEARGGHAGLEFAPVTMVGQ